MPLEQRRQGYRGRDGLRPVGDVGGEVVVVDGHPTIRVVAHDGELHVGGDGGGGGGVEVVDGGSDNGEVGLAGAEDQPDD